MPHVTLHLPDDVALYMVLVPRRLMSYAATEGEFKHMTPKEAEAKGLICYKSRPLPGACSTWTLEVYQGVKLSFKQVLAPPPSSPSLSDNIPRGVLPKNPPTIGDRHHIE